MGTVHRVGTMEISDDPEFSRKSWTAERIGWIGLGAVIVAGILGLLGSGFFSSATAGEVGDPLRVEFQRFGRHEADDRLTVHFTPQGRGGMADLWIDDRYLDAIEIRQIVPPPERIELQPDRKVFYFPAAEGSDTVQVWIDITYKKAGRLSGRLGSSTAPTVEVRQFIYP